MRWYFDIGTSVRPLVFHPEDYFQVASITVTYDDAKAYRKSTGSFLRVRQWQDIEAQVYIRQ